MQNMFIDRVVDYLVEQNFIKPDDKDVAAHMVREKFRDRESIGWHVSDVIDRAEQIGVELTETEARDILFTAIQRHDATVGLNWDVLDVHIEQR